MRGYEGHEGGMRGYVRVSGIIQSQEGYEGL